jgi:hypothetical protein
MLSLDPLRDPMHMLLYLDYFGLATHSTINDRWIIELVESDLIHIWHRNQQVTASCPLLDMPNWAFSYALALLRLHEDEGSEDSKIKADKAMQDAIHSFPLVVSMLLQANNVDVTGRSFRRDWPDMLGFDATRALQLQKHWYELETMDTVSLLNANQAVDLITNVFVKENAPLWGSDLVLDFMHDNLLAVKDCQDASSLPNPPSFALARYLTVDTSEYDRRIPQLPPEAVIVDPNLIEHALNVDTNRGRFLRRMNRQNANDFGLEQGAQENAWLMQQQQQIFGPPANEIDPDWPLLEVFWRR